MAESATLEMDPADARPEGLSPGFNTMAEKMEKMMAEVHATPKPPEPAPDNRPVEQKALKPEPKPTDKPKPPAAEPEKPATEKDEPFVSPKAADWKKLKAERDEFSKKASEHETAAKTHAEKLAAIEKEYTEYKTKTAIDPKEIEALKKANETYAEKLERLALQETPKFQNYYNSKFEAALNQALDAVGKDKSDQVKSVLEAPKSAWRKGVLNEVIGGIESEVDKLNLIAAVNEYDRTRDERDRQLANHRENLKEYHAVEEKRKQELQERNVAHRKTILDTFSKEAAKFESFRTGDDPEHNVQVAKNSKLLETFIMGGELDDATLAMLPIQAAEGLRLQKVVAQRDAKIAELEDAVKKYQTAAPALEGSGAPASEKATPKSYGEQVMENLRSIPGRAP